MKKLLCLVATMAALSMLVATGCAKKDLDVTKVEAAFQKDTDADKNELRKGLDAAKAGDYPKAIETLKKIAYNAHLSKEQRETLQELLRDIGERNKK